MIILPSTEHGDLHQPSRRAFLRVAAGAVASLAVPALAQQVNFWDYPRELWLRRPDVNEELRATYFANGELVQDGYDAICRILRDTHMNIAVQMDLVTLDIARGVFGWLQGFGMERPLIIHSGYRHPKTNASEGGVRNSLHIKGQAIDLHVQGVSAEAVSNYGVYLAGGGVGFYPSKNFTHLDRGRLRTWRG